MQFLKSLFCLQGFDNRTRFFAICSLCYVVFIILSAAFIGDFITSTLLLVLFTSLLALTCLRRLHDAKLNKKWLFAPSLTFALVGITVIFSQPHSSYYLFIIPAFCCAVLLTYPSTEKRYFILGYAGPVDMKEYQQETHFGKTVKYRIEPTLVASNNLNNAEITFNNTLDSSLSTHAIEKNNDTQNSIPYNKQFDIGEMIRLKLLSNKQAQWIIAAIFTLTLVVVVVSWFVNYLNLADQALVDNKISPQVMTYNRLHPLVMPDNYTLYLSEHQGITINWQADEVKNTTLWSQLTAQGDESCKELSFNKGELIRTLSVQVEKKEGINTNYFALFSPLDSKTLIQALAFRSSFTLCGYDFSLKGSQATLGKNKQYSHWVSY